MTLGFQQFRPNSDVLYLSRLFVDVTFMKLIITIVNHRFRLITCVYLSYIEK